MTTPTVTRETLTTVSMKELVVFYNAHNVDKPVAKFSDRKTAERRVSSILDSLDIIAAQGGDFEDGRLVDAPVMKTRASRAVNPGVMLTDINAALPEDEITEEDARKELDLLKQAKASTKVKTGAKSGLTLSAAIAASWNDPLVAQKRMTRHGVTVTCNGSSAEYKSVRAAFGALGLPDAKHIRFRMLVKEHGSAVFEFNGEKYHFTTMSAEDVAGDE